jgi:DNA-binding transcriptional LysR family regulator
MYTQSVSAFFPRCCYWTSQPQGPTQDTRDSPLLMRRGVLSVLIINELDSRHVDEIAAFLAVAAEHSFVDAGRSIHRHPTVVSKRIAALEYRLGVRLIERTTRQVRLTEAGTRLAERLRPAGELIAEAEREASASAAELRLAFPGAMGRRWLGPILPEFLALHALLSVEVDYAERYVDLVAAGYDAGIRVGALADSRLIAKKLSDHRRILCASPDYVKLRGMPETPRDLATHNCLGFTRLMSFPDWRLSNRDRKETVAACGSLISNDSEALLVAAKAGVGILGAGEWLMSRDIEAGALVRVLPQWFLDSQGGVYFVRPSVRFAPAKTEAFAKWISTKFSPRAPWALPRARNAPTHDVECNPRLVPKTSN